MTIQSCQQSTQERAAECEPWEFLREYLYYLQYGNTAEPASEMLLEHLGIIFDMTIPVALAAKNDDDYKQILSVGVELVGSSWPSRLLVMASLHSSHGTSSDVLIQGLSKLSHGIDFARKLLSEDTTPELKASAMSIISTLAVRRYDDVRHHAAKTRTCV